MILIRANQNSISPNSLTVNRLQPSKAIRRMNVQIIDQVMFLIQKSK